MRQGRYSARGGERDRQASASVSTGRGRAPGCVSAEGVAEEDSSPCSRAAHLRVDGGGDVCRPVEQHARHLEIGGGLLCGRGHRLVRVAAGWHPLLPGDEGADAAIFTYHGVLVRGWLRVGGVWVRVHVIDVALRLRIGGASRVGVHRPILPVGRPRERHHVSHRVARDGEGLPAVPFVESRPLHNARVVASRLNHGEQVRLEERHRGGGGAAVLL